MEKTPDQPSCTKRRGRPPKTVGSCETERPEGDAGSQGKVNTPENQAVPGHLHSGSRKRGRPPKSASKDVQNDSETNSKDRTNEDFHTSLSTPTSKSRNSRDATPVNSSGRRSSRTPKPVVEKDFVTPTSSRKSLTLSKPGHFEVDTQGENENLDCETEKTEDATESVHNGAVTNSNKKRKGRPRKQSLEAKSAPVDISMVEDKNDNLECETEKTEDATEPVHHDVVTNSTKKRRGRPRKQSLEAKSAPRDTSMDDNDNWECETEKTEDATESVHNESVKTSTKKKRGRPRKQSLEAKSATVDTSMIEDDNDNWECETEKTEDATESVHNESVKTSTKKKRGRPRKQSLEAKSATMDTSMEKTTLIVPDKRRRLPNQRYAEDDSEDERRSSVDTPRQPQANRGKGRPQRSSKVKNKVYAEDEQDSDREFETNSDTEDDYKDCAVEKRKRGRKRKRVSETSDSDKEQTPKRTKLESNKTPQTGKGKSKKVTIRKCVLCGAEFKDLQTIKRHMMVTHSLLYTADNPEGVSNSYLIVKLLGFIDCQKCSKRFRGGQYYNHHTMWCGREEEMAECEICNRSFKAMWLDQHVRSHRTNEKKLEKEKQEAAERAKKKLEEKGEESEPEEEGAGKKKKRKAAKSALKYLTQTKDADGEGGRGGSDGDSYKDSGNESSDTDGDKGEDEQDSRSDGEAEEDGLEDTAPRPGGRYLAKWKTLFRSLCKEPHKSNLQKLQDFYTNPPQQSMFLDLQPLRDEWKPLNFREKMKYLPDPGRCVDVCTSTKEVQSSEVKGEEAETTQHTLSFGQTCTVEGNSIGFTGAPIRALEWCPLPSDTSSGQVVAVALDSLDRPGAFNKATAGPGVVQFWSALDADERSSEDGPNQGVSLQCCLAHVAGRVRSMAWCPWRQPEQNQEQHPSSDGCLPRLGLLALACSNGTVQVYSVPQLHSLPAADSQDSSTFSSVLVVKPKSTLSLELNSKPSYCGQCLSVAWQQGGEVRYIAAGYGTGMVVVWDLQNTSPLLRTSKSVIRPLRCFLSHSSPVLSLAFCPQLPNLLASSSMDYTMCLTDVNRPGALQAEKRQVHPSIYRSLCWAGPIYLGLLCGEESLSMSSGCGMQYVGLCQMSMGRKMDAEFLVHNNMASTWDLDFCPHSLIAATCDANGKVKVILVDMVKMSTERANRKNFNTYELMFCPAALVYQTHIDSHKISTQAALSQSKQGHLSVKPESRLSETLSSSNSLETGDIAGDRQKNSQGTNPVPASADTSSETQTNPGFPPHHQVSPVINGNCTAFNIEGCPDNEGSTVSHSSGSKGNEKSHFSENVRTEKQSDTDQAYVSVQNEATGAEISCNQTVPSSKTLHAVKETCDNVISKFTKESDASSPARHFENGHQSQAESGENALTKASGLDVECEKVGGNQIKGAGTVHFDSFKKAKFEDLTANRRENVEELANPNNQLAYRVRLNPNPEHCAWLASGGQSGLLRLDDLSHILKSHRPDVMKLRAKSKS